jgi:hypothetical protein
VSCVYEHNPSLSCVAALLVHQYRYHVQHTARCRCWAIMPSIGARHQLFQSLLIRGSPSKAAREIQPVASLTLPSSPFSIALFCPGLAPPQATLAGGPGATWSERERGGQTRRWIRMTVSRDDSSTAGWSWGSPAWCSPTSVASMMLSESSWLPSTCADHLSDLQPLHGWDTPLDVPARSYPNCHALVPSRHFRPRFWRPRSGDLVAGHRPISGQAIWGNSGVSGDRLGTRRGPRTMVRWIIV